MRVQNVIRSPSSYNGSSHTSSWTDGKIIESRTLFGIYPPKIVVWSWSGVDVIGNLSGLKAVVFLWRFGPLVRDARAICGTRSPRVTSLSSLYFQRHESVGESQLPWIQSLWLNLFATSQRLRFSRSMLILFSSSVNESAATVIFVSSANIFGEATDRQLGKSLM